MHVIHALKIERFKVGKTVLAVGIMLTSLSTEALLIGNVANGQGRGSPTTAPASIEGISESELTNLIRQADHLKAQGDFRGAALILEQVTIKTIGSRGPNHPSVATSLDRLANLYSRQGLFEKAEELFGRSLLIFEKTLGAESPHVATSLNNLASLYYRQGLYSKAERLFQKSLQIKEKTLRNDDLSIASSLNNLAMLYQDQGLYGKAEPLFQRSLSILEQAHGSYHPSVATVLNNLASLYYNQGLYVKAQELFHGSLRIREKAFGADHPELGESLNNLALAYSSQGLFTKAESLILRSLRIAETSLGISHPDVTSGLTSLAVLYQDQGQYAKAEQLIKRSLRIREQVLRPDHADLAISLYNLGALYQHQGQYTRAETLLKKSLGIWESAFGAGNPNAVMALSNLAGINIVQGRLTQGLELLQSSENQQLKWLREQLPLLPTQDRLAQLTQLGAGFMTVFALIPEEPKAINSALLIRLNRQGLLQDVEQRQARLLNTARSTTEQVERLHNLSRQLANTSLPPERRPALQQEFNQIQAKLYRSLPDLELESVSVEVVAEELPPDGALVEFQRYLPFDRKRPLGKRWGPAAYMALILRPNGTITPVQLGSAQAIDTAIFQALQASVSNVSDATALWDKVSQLVLQPLQSHLVGSRQWFFSPDGELNRVPFGAIPSPQQNEVPLAQAVQLRLLTTGRDLLRLQPPTKSRRASLVIANPSYDRAQPSAQLELTAVSASTDRQQQRSAELNATRWAPLPATQQEGQQVAALLGVELISGASATTSVLQRLRGPRVLHVATHGFFAPDLDSKPSDPLRALQDNSQLLQGFRGEDPQLRSGLVLAGANQPEADPSDDGYLTAAEATGLQLDGTELVVLSACSTAQGAIKNGEGVYGLQRSLTVAGARSTLLSLWKVDDAATAEFMQRYYKRLKAGEGRADALQAVQQEFRTDPALKAKGWDSIYSWGAWQLVGDWRPIPGL
jgi:CHAT domain-containing protein/Tfp pilus assembly protein PilF